MAKSRVIDRDRGWTDIRKQARKSRKAHVAVGILGAHGSRDDGMTNAGIGTVHEYGAPEVGVPERSFIRATMDSKASEYRALAKRLGGMIASKQISIEQALGLFGARAVSDIRRRIQFGIDPPLAPKTIRRKGSSKPLIDTGQLVNAITWEVRK